MNTALDTSVLLDLLSGDPSFSRQAAEAVHAALQAGAVAICPIVYAELAASFLADADGLDRFLQSLSISVDQFLPTALRHAASAWTVYLRNRGPDAQCPNRGHDFAIVRPDCRGMVRWRRRTMPDFLVGAHALIQADELLTRDRRTYSTYFPDLALRTVLKE